MSVNEYVLQGDWNRIKGKLRAKWGQLTDNDLDQVHGDVEQMIGLIQQKTGQTRSEIQDYLDQITDDAASRLTEAGGTIRNYAENASDHVSDATQHIADTVQDASEQAMKQVRAGYVRTERMIRQRPVESLAVCFGAGLITGLVAGLAMRSK